MESLLQPKPYTEVLKRLATLQPDTKPLWGKMNASQMLKHCQRPLEIAVKGKTFGLKSNFIIRWFFKSSMYNDKPFVKNMPTPKGFKVTEDANFTNERDQLINLIEEFHKMRGKENWPHHPVFGFLTTEQWGKMQYKHLDHHLRQFKV